MTVIKASNAPVGLNKGKPVRAISSTPAVWQRPSDWVTFTTPTAAEQKVIGIVAVWNQASNYVALACTTSAGTYTVDWGDGTSTTHSSTVTAEKNYVWGDISSGTLSSRGYRQAVITVTPTTGGATFSAVNLNRRHSGISSNSTSASNPWLDVAVAAPNATTIAFSFDTAGTRTSSMALCEQVTIVAQNVTNMSHMFKGFNELQSVPLFNTASVTNMSLLFEECYSLQTVPLFNTASVTNMSRMFLGCFSLQTVPLFNTVLVTNMSSMFQTCSSLQTVPLFNTAAVTSMSSMFSGCSSLQTVPLFNTSLVTDMSIMFNACYFLQTVPLFNTVSVTTMFAMFQNCSSLQTVPLFNTAAVTSMGTMFSVCSSLQTVPLFNTAAVTNMSIMFNACSSLREVPLFNTAAVTNMLAMFQNCYSLREVPLFNTAAVTNTQVMFNGCLSLQTVPLFNTSAVTTAPSMFTSCVSLQNIPELNLTKVSSNANNNMALGNATATSAASNLGQAKLTGNRWTQSFQNCKMGAAQLDEMYTALATLNPAVTNVTSTGTVVTYTVADIRAFVAGRTVSITGVDPVAYNLTSVTVGTVTAGAGNTGTFTVTNAATGAYVSGGVAALQDNRLITVTSNPGTASDDPTIATNKGWQVTG
jgi:surface protein